MITIPALIGVAIAFFVGMIWYGFVFNKQYMRVIPNKKDQTNKIAVAIQLTGLVLLSALIQTIHNVAEDSLYEIVAILLGYGVVISLAGVLFQYGNNRNSTTLWAIIAGSEIVSTLIIVACVRFIAI